MNSIRIKWSIFLAVVISILLTSGPGQRAFPKTREPADLTKKNLKLKGYPRAAWRESFPRDIRDYQMAWKTGEVLVYTNKRVWYYDSSGKLIWKQGEGRDWKHITGGGVSDDGRRIMFQVNLEKKISTNLLELDIYYLDREGHLLWTRDNPYRYNSSQLSRTGSYIVFGDPLEKKIKVHDQNLNLLWQHDLYKWYISFDPKEHFLFDAVEGLLFNMEGRQVWDVGGHARILSVSDDAEVILTQRFLGRKSTNEIYLIARTALKKVTLMGAGGCVSPDGSLVAIVAPDKKLKIYRTQELLNASMDQLPPLFQCNFLKASMLNFSRDNMTLLVFGRKSLNQTSMLLVGLNQNRVLWEKWIQEDIKKVLTTEDNRYILQKTDPTTIEMFMGY